MINKNMETYCTVKETQEDSNPSKLVSMQKNTVKNTPPSQNQAKQKNPYLAKL